MDGSRNVKVQMHHVGGDLPCPLRVERRAKAGEVRVSRAGSEDAGPTVAAPVCLNTGRPNGGTVVSIDKTGRVASHIAAGWE